MWKEVRNNMDIKEYLTIIGKRGGKATLAKHGKEHFKRASKLGTAARWKGHIKTSKIQERKGEEEGRSF